MRILLSVFSIDTHPRHIRIVDTNVRCLIIFSAPDFENRMVLYHL